MEIKKISTESFQKEVLESDVPVLIDFYADWCGACSIMSPLIEEVAKSTSKDNVKIGKINIDENQDLAIKYDIENIPTLILFKNGEVEKTMVGVSSKDEILNAIQ